MRLLLLTFLTLLPLSLGYFVLPKGCAKRSTVLEVKNEFKVKQVLGTAALAVTLFMPGQANAAAQAVETMDFSMPTYDSTPAPALNGARTNSGYSIPTRKLDLDIPSEPSKEVKIEPKYDKPEVPKFEKPKFEAPKFEKPDVPKFEAPKFENPAPKPATKPAPAPAPAPAPKPAPKPKLDLDIEAPSKPKVEKPKFETPKFDAPKFDAPKFDAPKFDAPKFETPKFETPKFETPKFDAPKFDTPKFDTPKFDTPKFDTPKFDTPKFDTPKFDAPKFSKPNFSSPSISPPSVPKFETPLLTPKSASDLTSTSKPKITISESDQAALDSYAASLSAKYDELNSQAKGLERAAGKARQKANEAKRMKRTARNEACENRVGGKIICVRPVGSGY